MKTVSLIIPAYNEEESLPLLYDKLCEFTENHTQYDWEILFVATAVVDKQDFPIVLCVILGKFTQLIV